MSSHPYSITPSPNRQSTLNALTNELFAYTSAEPVHHDKHHPLSHILETDENTRQYYKSLSVRERDGLHYTIADDFPISDNKVVQIFGWLCKCRRMGAQRKFEGAIVRPFQTYEQQTMNYPVAVGPAIPEERRAGEPGSLRLSRRYVEGALEADGRTFVFDDSSSVVRAIVQTTSGSEVFGLIYNSGIPQVYGLQRQNNAEYKNALPNADPTPGYYQEEVTPRFLGGGALPVDEAFEAILGYACRQEQEYRRSLAQRA